jgi:hypothetical protein
MKPQDGFLNNFFNPINHIIMPIKKKTATKKPKVTKAVKTAKAKVKKASKALSTAKKKVTAAKKTLAKAKK